jgi:hypothetical protein
VGAAAIAALASRLTERDRLVALACHEHRVLTTEQLRRLYFRSRRSAELRIAQLYELKFSWEMFTAETGEVDSIGTTFLLLNLQHDRARLPVHRRDPGWRRPSVKTTYRSSHSRIACLFAGAHAVMQIPNHTVWSRRRCSARVRRGGAGHLTGHTQACTHLQVPARRS